MTPTEDAGMIMSLGEGVKDSMLFTLVVPFCFMLFMSVSMDRVWSMYLMLQLTSNLMNLSCIQRPGNVEYLLFMGQKISDFKVASEPNIQHWLKFYVFKNVQWLQDILMGQGTFLLSLEIFILILALIKFAQKFC